MRSKAPLNINPKSNVIVVETLFQGKSGNRLIKMILDTGASVTTIPIETALAIGCNPTNPKRRIEIITASGTEYVPVVVVPKVAFFGFKLENIEVACLNLPPQSLVSGLLGLNILVNFDVFLGFKSKSMEFNT